MLIFLSILSCLLVTTNVLTTVALIAKIKKNSIYEQWILDYQKEVNDAYISMKYLDDKEMFSKDDQVGVSFQSLLSILRDLDNKIK